MLTHHMQQSNRIRSQNTICTKCSRQTVIVEKYTTCEMNEAENYLPPQNTLL